MELSSRKRRKAVSNKEYVKRQKIQSTMRSLRNKKGKCLSPTDIINLIDLWRDWRDDPTTASKTYFSNRVSTFLLWSMCRSNFQEGEYVKSLLNSILEMQNEDHFLIEVVMPLDDHFRLVQPLDNVLQFQEYFLRHVYDQKMLFNGIRLTCLYPYPIGWAFHAPTSRLLHNILRYGALLSHEKYRFKFSSPDFTEYKYTRPGSGFHHFLVEIPLSRILNLNPRLLAKHDLILDPHEMESYENVVSCWNLLLRDFSHWTTDLKDAISHVKFNRSFVLKHLRKMSTPDFIEALSSNVLPNYKNHLIVSLKQACRLCIRRVLNENWFLPRGIYALPIPEPLKLYLDLYSD